MVHAPMNFGDVDVLIYLTFFLKLFLQATCNALLAWLAHFASTRSQGLPKRSEATCEGQPAKALEVVTQAAAGSP